ncbi:MAG: PDZ domain-containing protein [Desulfobacteraceae bacterium]|nr:MAG: PDZ domain-containing protein [Desulfobacteraceae bacterium]
MTLNIRKHNIPFIFLLIHLLAACAAPIKPTVSLPEHAASSDEKPFLGIGYTVVDDLKSLPIPDTISKGLRITHLVPESAAHHAGLKIGDIIISCDGQEITDTTHGKPLESFREYIQTAKKPGDTLLMEVIRKNTTMTARRNHKTTRLHHIDDIRELVDRQPPNSQIAVQIDKEVSIRKINVVLASKPGIRREPLPENKTLYPDREAVHDPYRDLSLNLIHDFQLRDTYEAILAKFETDEQWDDGFRLNLFRYMHRDPLRAHMAADRTCSNLEKQAGGKQLPELLTSAAELLDENIMMEADALPCPPDHTRKPAEHFRYMETTIRIALANCDQAFHKISGEDRQFLINHLFEPLLDYDNAKISLADDGYGIDESLQKIAALSHDIDYSSLIKAAQILTRLADEQWLADFQKVMTDYSRQEPIRIAGVHGNILYAADTPAGKLIIGGTGPNRYDMESAVIIDLGGDDIYLNGTGNADRKGLSVIIDISGNDRYSATGPVSIGSGILGIGMLADLAGDDVYTGTAFTQGAGIMGIGILADFQGNDQYSGQEYAQGVGIWGVGILLDHTGDDVYSSTLLSQGAGGPKGIGLLSDMTGNDQYRATGKHKSSYGTKGIFNGLSQGFGFGFRGYASGGIGILIDGEGNDVFHAGNFSQGCGYFFGLGILKSAGHGDDRYMGSRYAQGCSAHSAAGILMDDGGNDHYSGTVGALQGAAWDMGIAVLVDKSGDDIYDSRHLFFSQGAADLTGLAIFTDQDGADQYRFTDNEKNTGIHDPHADSLSIFMDCGGDTDLYNGETRENNRIRLSNEQSLRIDLDEDIEQSLLNSRYKKLINKTETEGGNNQS